MIPMIPKQNLANLNKTVEAVIRTVLATTSSIRCCASFGPQLGSGYLRQLVANKDIKDNLSILFALGVTIVADTEFREVCCRKLRTVGFNASGLQRLEQRAIGCWGMVRAMANNYNEISNWG